MHDLPMVNRGLSLVAAAVATVVGVVYAQVMRDQGDTPVVWFVLLLVVGAGASAAAAFVPRPRPFAVLATVVLTVSMVISILSVGILLLPAVLASVLTLGRRTAPAAG